MVTFNYEEKDDKTKVVIERININSIPLAIIKKLLDEDYKNGDTANSNLLVDIFESKNQKAIETAIQYYDRKLSLGKIISIIEKSAESGNDDLYFYLYKYYISSLKSLNKEKAIYFCTLAANNKNQEACLDLADYYKNGKFVDKDLSKAAHYYEMCGIDLNPEDDYLVAEVADKENRFETALKYYTLAINKNYMKAYFPLAELYYKHYFSSNNYRTLYNCYTKAQEFDPDNKRIWGMIYYLNGFFYLNNIDIVWLKSNDEAINHLRYAVNLGIKDAEILLNEYLKQENIYQIGKKYFFEYNYQSAVDNFKISSKLVHDAKYMLGLCYEQGLGVEQNYAKAFKLFSELINSAEALFMVGRYFENGYGVVVDLNKANEMYEKSYRFGKKEAAFALGEMFYKLYGLGCFIKDDKESVSQKDRITYWYNCAPEYLGKAKLYVIEVLIYEKGKKNKSIKTKIKNKLSIKNDLDAFLLLKKADELGNKESYELLAQYYEKGNSDCNDNVRSLELAIKYYRLAGKYNLKDYSDKIHEITYNIEAQIKPFSKKMCFVISLLIFVGLIFGLLQITGFAMRYIFIEQIKQIGETEKLNIVLTMLKIFAVIACICVIKFNLSQYKKRKEYKKYKENAINY